MSDDNKTPEVPGSENGMFMYHYTLEPTTTMGLGEVIDILKMLNIKIDQKNFDKLQESTKKHFVVENRYEQRWRYGTKPRGR